MTIHLRTLAIVAVLVLVLGACVAALVVYLGVYNVAATVPHTRPVHRLLDYAMYRSTRARSGSIAAPRLTERQRILSGAVHYRAHCLQCHGAPGVAPDALAYGMTPAPVNLMPTARHWKPQEVFWVVKHGIKMTGMPAWEYQMSDDEIWSTVAFVMAMSSMAPVEYAALVQSLPAHETERRAAPPVAGAPAPAVPATLPERAAIGDVQAGRRAAQQYLCATCHVMPGIVGADRHVGPPLSAIGTRKYIAGVVVNNPQNMVRWLMNPQQLDPLSAMPNLGLKEKEARDIAAYLYTLDYLR